MMPSPHQLVINELAALNLNNIISYNDEHFATETKTCQPVALEPNKPIEQNIFSNSADGKNSSGSPKEKVDVGRSLSSLSTYKILQSLTRKIHFIPTIHSDLLRPQSYRNPD